MEPKPKGTYATSSGIQIELSTDYDGLNGSEVQGVQQRVSDGLQDGEAGYKDFSPERVSAESSWEVKEEGSQNTGSSTDLDPHADSILNLGSVKEALEKELLKFREIRQDVLVNDSVRDLPTQFTNVGRIPRETSPELSQSSEEMQRFFFAPRSEVLETETKVVQIEDEDLFMRKVEAEIQYLALSRKAENLRVVFLDQLAVVDEQKNLASTHAQILNKLGNTEKKARMLNEEASKLEKFSEDIARADEALELQNRVCKYTTCFFVQLVTLVLVLGIFIFQLSPRYVDVVPT